MSGVSTNFKRGFVRWIQDTATDGATTIALVLKSLRAQSMEQASFASQVTQTSANGHSTTFSVPDTFDIVGLGDLVEEITRRYEEAAVKLGGTPTDAQLTTEVLRCLQKRTRIYRDFSDVRLGAWINDDNS